MTKQTAMIGLGSRRPEIILGMASTAGFALAQVCARSAGLVLPGNA